jgi:hypothetical protein
VGELFDHDVLEFDPVGGPVHDRGGKRVGGISVARDSLVIREGHQAFAALAVVPWVTSTRLGFAGGHPVIDRNERVLGFVGRSLDAYSADGACLFRGGWWRTLKTPDGKDVAVFEKVQLASWRWRISFGAIAAPEIRGLALAAVFIDRASRMGN